VCRLLNQPAAEHFHQGPTRSVPRLAANSVHAMTDLDKASGHAFPLSRRQGPQFGSLRYG
jgi:hypothetical protein